jgi:hypothetical protein
MNLVTVHIKPADAKTRGLSYKVNAAYNKPFHIWLPGKRVKDTRLNVASGEDVCLLKEETYVFH